MLMPARKKDLNNLRMLRPQQSPSVQQLKQTTQEIKSKIIQKLSIASSQNKKEAEVNSQLFFNDWLQLKSENSSPFSLPENKSMLIIIACHSNTDLKCKTLLNNLNFFLQVTGAKILIVNSAGTLDSKHSLFHFFAENKIRYIEVANEKTLDFGKWDKALSLDENCTFDYFVFTNDSILIHSSIIHFFHLLLKSTAEIYGYNDSSEYKYHFQSYLFGLKREAIPQLICLFDSQKHKLHCYDDVVKLMELNLANSFHSKDCFLKIANVSGNEGKNVFFKNDSLLHQLQETQLLPFTKIKRILGVK
jgi:hypothetical protein